jgi:protein phosphatase
MGGHAAGEVASRLAVRLVVEHLSRSGRNDCGATEGLLSDALCLAHAGVQSAAQASKEWRGMGATLVAAVLRNGTLHTAHVGDVRCYAHSAGGLRQLTRDHSVVAHLVEDGVIAPEDVRTHPRRHEVLQALGTATDIVPEYHSTVLLDGDSVLLCSDGLWESLTDEEIERVFNDSTDAEATARRLVDQANALGGADNITVVVYHHRAGAGPEEGSNHPPAPAEG